MAKYQISQQQHLQELLFNLNNLDTVKQTIQVQLEESTESNSTTQVENTTANKTEIDWNNVRLPEDHPLVKTLNLYKSKAKELEDQYKGIDPAKYQEYSKLATEIETNRKKAEEAALTEKEQWAALADRRVGEVETRYQAELNQLKQQLEALTGERDQFKTSYESTQSNLLNLQKDRELRSLLSENDFDFSDEDNFKLFQLDYGKQFEYDLDKGLTAKSGSKKVDPLELIKEIKQKKAKFWKGVIPSGSGSVPGSLTAVSTSNSTSESGVLKLPKAMKNASPGEWLKLKITPAEAMKRVKEGTIIFEET